MLARLSTLDRFLPVWIIAAMALGLALGRLIPGLDVALSAVEVGSVSLPIALGLLVMMYPVLAKVRYTQLGRVTRGSAGRRMLIASLVLNWVLGPALMFALAWLLLPDSPEFRTGLVIVGLARCIAMVLIWNDLACGDREAAAVLVAINSVFQILAFAALGWFYLQVLPAWLGLETASADVSVAAIVVSVLVFLGIPLAAGYLTRTLGERARGRDWYEQRFLPGLGSVGAVRAALHHRAALRPAGRRHHLRSRRRRPDRAAAAGLLRRHVRRVLRPRKGDRAGLRPHHDAELHRGGQQLRARHRGRHRHLRGHLRARPWPASSAP